MIAVAWRNTMASARPKFRERPEPEPASLPAASIVVIDEAARRDAEIQRFLAVRPITEFDRIVRRAVKVFRVLPSELKGGERHQRFSIPRAFIAYWACRRTKLSLPQIGRLLGGKDHTSILAATRKHPQRRAAQGRTLRPAR